MTKLTADKRTHLDDAKFAFPKERKEPIENASHVRNAIARFDQVEGVSDAERDAAWKRITAGGEEVRRRGERELLARARQEGRLTQVEAGARRRAAQ